MLNPTEVLPRSLAEHLFSTSRELVPDLDDYYEMELAFYESLLLDDQSLIRNSAYFSKIGDNLTRHFKMCAGESLRLPGHSSSRLKSFFEKNIFRTGYATHGLFPYRGKFHPQMVKGIMNAMGLKPGDTVVDPMMGSGTVAVEASLMGINSFGFDASPFCRFMAQTKLDALTMPLERARKAVANADAVFLNTFSTPLCIPGDSGAVPCFSSRSASTGLRRTLFPSLDVLEGSSTAQLPPAL